MSLLYLLPILLLYTYQPPLRGNVANFPEVGQIRNIVLPGDNGRPYNGVWNSNSQIPICISILCSQSDAVKVDIPVKNR